MNKNLKKVISTVAALAVSASSMVAFAAGFPDVPETASYNQAVKELTALKVVDGYEDGTFAPDKNVTRAEITKMIVAGLGSGQLSAANAATGKDTKFNDVTGSHWASGFVTVGTTDSTKFIDGYDDVTFGPEDNVTYAQAIKMLVSACGYTTYAENNGGWPNGYLNYGYTLDITKGISGVSNDTQVTRAQVAQMIDNALKAPICVIDGYETQWNGTQTPKLVEKNEPSAYTKNSWQCLLNYSHDAYIVYGRVKDTHQSSSTIDKDEVKISLEKSDNYDGYMIDSKGLLDSEVRNENAYIGDSEADKHLMTYSEMLIALDDDDELTILSITPIGADSKSVQFAAEDYSEEDSEFSGDKNIISVFQSGSSTKTTDYKVDPTALADKFYVNGYQVGAPDLQTALSTYVDGNSTGTVTLIDSPANGSSSTDGVYDIIKVTRYLDAVVSSVTGDEEECTIYFDSVASGLGIVSRLDVDTTDDDKYYSFQLADGTEVKPSELEENDVLSIAYVGSDFTDSDSYDVLVSRDTVEGKLTSISSDTEDLDKEYTVGGTVYKVADTNLVGSGDLKVSNEYTLYLDAFGKVAFVDETAANKKIAIVENAYTANGDQSYVSIITPDGNKTNYLVDDTKLAEYKEIVFVNKESGTKNPLKDRVYTYSISSSSNKLTLKDHEVAKEAVGETYKESGLKIGGVKLSETSTSIIDFSDYATDNTEFDAMDMSSLEDDAEYTAYGFNKSNSDNTYSFVIITEGGSGSYSYNTRFAIFSKAITKEVDDEDRTAMVVYEAGKTEATEVVLDDENLADGLVEGTPIVIKKNSTGYATGVESLFASTTDLNDGYSTFATAAREAIKDGDLSSVLDVTTLDNIMTKGSGSNQSGWIFGLVYDRTSSSISIATDFDSDKGDYVSVVDNIEDYDVDSDAKVLVYDYSQRSGKSLRVTNGVLSSVVSVNAPKAAYVDYNTYDKDYLNWGSDALEVGNETSTYGAETFVLAKTIDGDIVEVYAIVPSSKK